MFFNILLYSLKDEVEIHTSSSIPQSRRRGESKKGRYRKALTLGVCKS